MATGTGHLTPRSTRQRLALAGLLTELHGFRSAQEIYAALRERGDSVGLSTVYRNLDLMVETGEVDVLTHDDGEQVYFLCSRRHHHHLVCRLCGHAIEITGPAVEQWAQAVAEQHGYTDISHTLEVFGLCSECRSTVAATR